MLGSGAIKLATGRKLTRNQHNQKAADLFRLLIIHKVMRNKIIPMTEYKTGGFNKERKIGDEYKIFW